MPKKTRPKPVAIVRPPRLAELHARLLAAGFEMTSDRQPNQIRTWTESYLHRASQVGVKVVRHTTTHYSVFAGSVTEQGRVLARGLYEPTSHERIVSDAIAQAMTS